MCRHLIIFTSFFFFVTVSAAQNSQTSTIITQSGRVTLQGQVANDLERSKVADIAKRVAGIESLSNQTEVSLDY